MRIEKLSSYIYLYKCMRIEIKIQHSIEPLIVYQGEF